MASRDRFTLKLACGRCDTSGEAHISEDDYPFMSSPRFNVDHCPKGFEVTLRADTSAKTQIACTKCGERVHGR